MIRITLTLTDEENKFLTSLAKREFREKRQQGQLIFTSALRELMKELPFTDTTAATPDDDRAVEQWMKDGTGL